MQRGMIFNLQYLLILLKNYCSHQSQGDLFLLSKGQCTIIVQVNIDQQRAAKWGIRLAMGLLELTAFTTKSHDAICLTSTFGFKLLYSNPRAASHFSGWWLVDGLHFCFLPRPNIPVINSLPIYFELYTVNNSALLMDLMRQRFHYRG